MRCQVCDDGNRCVARMTVSDVSLMQVSARKLAAGAHTISVQAKQRAELNVSEAHLREAMTAVDAWTSDLSAHVSLTDAGDVKRSQARAEALWPYQLLNESGCRLRFWAGRSPSPPAEAAVHHVEAGGCQAFAFASLAAGASGGMELHSVSVEWLHLHPGSDGQRREVRDGDGGPHERREVLTNVPVDAEGVHMFALPSGLYVVVEIQTGARGTKLIKVQSVVKVCNFCDHVLEVGVFSRKSAGPIFTRDIRPDGQVCLPMDLRDCYCLKVRSSLDLCLTSLRRSCVQRA